VSSPVESFLEEFRRRTWDTSDIAVPDGFTPLGYYLPQAGSSIEVVVVRAERKPSRKDALALWRARQRGRSTGVLLVVAHPSPGGAQAFLVGLHRDETAADVDLSAVERRVAAALDAGTEREALDLLEGLLQASDAVVPGVRNKGLFATHELEVNTPHRADWATASASARPARGRAGEELLRALGWSVQHAGADLLLRPQGKDADRAVAVLLEGEEIFERPSFRYGLGTSPVEHGLEVARGRELPWVLAVRGTVVRLYAADPDVGVMRTGAASFVELDVAELTDDALGYAWLLLTPSALGRGGSVDEILRGSRVHATALGERLRERIYVDVVPPLARTIASRLGNLGERGLVDAYHHTLVILFRLLFVAYAEDRGLLPYDVNTVYTRNALKTRAKTWSESRQQGLPPHFDTQAVDIWNDLVSIWKAVHDGHSDWGVPDYGGSLFRTDSPSGQAIARLSLTNNEIGPVLEALLVDSGRDGTLGPVDFQALSVREFGTIYEGLLESSLSLAPTDLAVDPKTKAYVPAADGSDVEVPAGQVYFHNASGARKATGSYFTKEFAVEHLLETVLDPTVKEHVARVEALLDAGREADAAEALFDFRVADIAMGSGHFLVGAVDHVATAMSDLVSRRQIAGVRAELESMRAAALRKLAEFGVPDTETPEITLEALLRRQVARRCIYGVDVNEIAVELARLALWIHTFVPGLPMSSLDHGLVHGDSLVGIGTIDEALDALEPERRGAPGVQSLFADGVTDALLETDEPLRRAERIAEVTTAETLEAEALRREASERTADVSSAFDAIVAARLGMVDLRLLAATGWQALVAAGRRPDVQDEVGRLRPVHFPVAFPEAFRPGRERPGFDVILGNPPWEKVKVEEHGWWGLRFPGLRSMAQKEKNASIERYRLERPDLLAEYESEVALAEARRELLKAGPYDLGSGDTDLYQVFCWRDWVLVREGGRIGVVFPRGALSGSALGSWRREILDRGAFDDVCFLTNSQRWIFGEVHPQYTVALTTVRRGGERTVSLSGPFHSLADFLDGRTERLVVAASDFLAWSSAANFPLLPSSAATGVFQQMRRHPRLDAGGSFEVRPISELHTSANKSLYDFDLVAPRGDLPVLTGASFSLWDPDHGSPYAYALSRDVKGLLQKRRLRQIGDARTAFFGLSREWAEDERTLPLSRARVAFRDVARSTDTRTVITALVPPGVALVEKAPYLYRMAGTASHDAYVLGVLSSIPLDWFARRYVEVKVSYGILCSVPVPRPAPDDPLYLRTVEISGRLAAVDDRFADWAAEVGVPVGSATDPTVKEDLIAELDAVVGHLYGLSRDDMRLIFETFHRGWDHGPRLAAVLAHFDRWSASLGVAA